MIGVWYVDFELAGLRLNKKYDPCLAIEALVKQIEVFDGGARWFIRDFVHFQYGELKPNNNLHRSVIEKIKRLGLGLEKEKNPLPSTPGDSQGMSRGYPGAKEKDKEKDKDKVKEKEKEISRAREVKEEGFIIPEGQPIDCDWCGWVKNEANHKKCHYCFKIYKPGENIDNHRC